MFKFVIIKITLFVFLKQRAVNSGGLEDSTLVHLARDIGCQSSESFTLLVNVPW